MWQGTNRSISERVKVFHQYLLQHLWVCQDYHGLHTEIQPAHGKCHKYMYIIHPLADKYTVKAGANTHA